MTAGISDTIARAIYEGRNGKGCKLWGSQTKAHKEPYLLDAQAALSALKAEGFVVVPAEPTDKMICAALDDYDKRGRGKQSYRDIYRAMLQAAQGGDNNLGGDQGSSARSSAGSVQPPSKRQVAGSNPAERASSSPQKMEG